MGNYLRMYTTMGKYYGPYGSFSARVGSVRLWFGGIPLVVAISTSVYVKAFFTSLQE